VRPVSRVVDQWPREGSGGNATWLSRDTPVSVIPANAGGVVQGCTVYGPEDGIQENRLQRATWIPAFAGMTVVLGLTK
jgi:hypothetical protein